VLPSISVKAKVTVPAGIAAGPAGRGELGDTLT
jgi:hypothetical protein